MAHGNMSDLIFLALLLCAIQWLGFPDTLFQDLGFMKAQFSTKTSGMEAAIKFGGCLLLMLGLTFSGVSWNPINGKMAGLGGFITSGYLAYNTFKTDSDVFVPRFFYIYAGIIFIGSLHIFVFPSNPLPPKTPETKNNHGNFSDLVALGLIIASVACFFYPDHLFQDLGPLKAQFSAKSAGLSAAIKLIASLMLIQALMFSGVKWNPINGKMAGLGGFIVAGYTSFSTFKADSDMFVFRPFYIYASLYFLGSLHIFAFPSNPKVAKVKKED